MSRILSALAGYKSSKKDLCVDNQSPQALRKYLLNAHCIHLQKVKTAIAGHKFNQQVFLREQHPGASRSSQHSRALRLLPGALGREQSCSPSSVLNQTLGIPCSSRFPKPKAWGHLLPALLSAAGSACAPVSGSRKRCLEFLVSHPLPPPSRLGCFSRAQQTVSSYTPLLHSALVSTGSRRLTLGIRASKQVPSKVLHPFSGNAGRSTSSPESSLSVYAPELLGRPGEGSMEWQAQLPDHPAAVSLQDPGSTFSWMRCLKASGPGFKNTLDRPSLVPYCYWLRNASGPGILESSL